MSLARTVVDASPRRRFRLNWPMLAFLPLTTLNLVLFVLPMLVMGIASVLVIREFHVEYRLTANNYLFFLGNPLYLTLLIRSVLIAVAVTVICLILAFPFAHLLTLIPKQMQRMMTVLVILPFWTSYLLRVYAWMTILGERGLINRTLMGLGILDEPVRFLLYNNYAVVLVSVYLYIPYCLLALDTALFSAAMDLGARPRQVFLRFGIGSAMVFVITALSLVMLLVLRRVARLEKVFGG